MLMKEPVFFFFGGGGGGAGVFFFFFVFFFFGGGGGDGLFPFLFLQGFEANIVLITPHLIPEITMFRAIKLW